MNDDIKTANRIRKDGWANLFTGLGTKADKSKHTVNKLRGIVIDEELENIYADDGLGAKIVDLLPEDMLKQGWKYTFQNEKEGMEDLSAKYDEVLDSVKIHAKISQAFKWARLYGGSIIVIGAYDGQDLDQPLIVRKIRTFESLRVVARPNIQFGTMEFQTDPNKPRFGEVEYYPITFRVGNTFQTARVHYSRVIEFHGIEVPNTGKSVIPNEYRYWGLPCLQRIRDRLGDLGTAFGSLSNLMQEITVGKYKFKDLADILSTKDGSKLMQNRLQTMDLMKSVFHSVLMDAEDEYVRDTLSLGGVSDVLYQFFTVISAGTGYPMTRLFGVSPAGLNATGDSDTYAYYDMVRAKQQLELKPVLNRLVGIVSEWMGWEMPEIEFNPLEQMTEKEQAELEEKKANTEKTKAETYQAYIDMGIMEPYMVEELEFGDTLKNIEKPADYDDSLPGVTDIEELQQQIAQLQQQQAMNNPTNPPVETPEEPAVKNNKNIAKQNKKK